MLFLLPAVLELQTCVWLCLDYDYGGSGYLSPGIHVWTLSHFSILGGKFSYQKNVNEQVSFCKILNFNIYNDTLRGIVLRNRGMASLLVTRELWAWCLSVHLWGKEGRWLQCLWAVRRGVRLYTVSEEAFKRRTMIYLKLYLAEEMKDRTRIWIFLIPTLLSNTWNQDVVDSLWDLCWNENMRPFVDNSFGRPR